MWRCECVCMYIFTASLNLTNTSMTSFHPWNSMGKGATFIALHFHPKTRFQHEKLSLSLWWTALLHTCRPQYCHHGIQPTCDVSCKNQNQKFPCIELFLSKTRRSFYLFLEFHLNNRWYPYLLKLHVNFVLFEEIVVAKWSIQIAGKSFSLLLSDSIICSEALLLFQLVASYKQQAKSSCPSRDLHSSFPLKYSGMKE